MFLFIYIKFTMEIARIKNLKKNESAVLLYILLKQITNAKQISRILEIDIYQTYKILKLLLERKLIIKLEGQKFCEYKIIDELK